MKVMVDSRSRSYPTEFNGPVFAISTVTMLTMGGNHFEFKPQFSRQDASYGHVLLGNKGLDFEWVDYAQSGFFVRDEIRYLKVLKGKSGNKFMVAAINNGVPRIFKMSK